MIKKTFNFFLFSFLVSLFSAAQEYELELLVLDSENEIPLETVNILIDSPRGGGITNSEGVFKIKLPSREYKLSLAKSKNYDLNQDKFVNEEIGVIEKMKEEGSFWKKPLKNLKNNWFFSSNETNPKVFLPEKKNLINEDFKKSLNNIKFVWLGHSSLMISINNKIILTDPVFSPSASPFSWFIKRYQKNCSWGGLNPRPSAHKTNALTS